MTTEMETVKTLLGNRTIGELIELAIQLKDDGPGLATSQSGPVFRKEGETWVLGFAGKRVYAKDRVGLQYIAQLLAGPRRSMPVMSLYRAASGAPMSRGRGHGGRELAEARAASDWQPGDRCTPEALADAPALAECQGRLREIEAELLQAEDANDEGRTLTLRDEREKLGAYLRSCNGHNGRLRMIADATERARKAVSNAITRAISAVFEQHDVLGRHLRNSVRTGYQVSYDPETPVDWQL